MDRRGFLYRAMLATAGLAVDPERLFWTPKPMITVPAMPTIVYNSFYNKWLLVWDAPTIFPKGSTAGLRDDEIRRVTYIGDGARERTILFA